MEEYKLLINRKWTNSSNNETVNNINPAIPEKLATFQVSSESDESYTVESALKIFKEWRQTPPPKSTILPSKSTQILEYTCTYSVIRFWHPLVITRKETYTGPDRFEAALKRAAS
jgi:hypothetical protein